MPRPCWSWQRRSEGELNRAQAGLHPKAGLTRLLCAGRARACSLLLACISCGPGAPAGRLSGPRLLGAPGADVPLRRSASSSRLDQASLCALLDLPAKGLPAHRLAGQLAELAHACSRAGQVGDKAHTAAATLSQRRVALQREFSALAGDGTELGLQDWVRPALPGPALECTQSGDGAQQLSQAARGSGWRRATRRQTCAHWLAWLGQAAAIRVFVRAWPDLRPLPAGQGGPQGRQGRARRRRAGPATGGPAAAGAPCRAGGHARPGAAHQHLPGEAARQAPGRL